MESILTQAGMHTNRHTMIFIDIDKTEDPWHEVAIATSFLICLTYELVHRFPRIYITRNVECILITACDVMTGSFRFNLRDIRVLSRVSMLHLWHFFNQFHENNLHKYINTPKNITNQINFSKLNHYSFDAHGTSWIHWDFEIRD